MFSPETAQATPETAQATHMRQMLAQATTVMVLAERWQNWQHHSSADEGF